MKKLGAVLFGIVLILGLSIVTGVAQEVETVDPDGIVSFSGAWSPVPSVERLNDWDSNPDASSAGINDEGYNIMRLNFEEPKPGSYTAIKVKLRVNSASNDYNNKLNVRIFAEGTQLGDDWTLRLPEILDFTEYPNEEYPNEWLVNMTAAQLADLQVEIEVTEYNWGSLQFSAIQVELISEGPISEEPDPIHVNIEYRPYKKSNPLNYRSRGTVRVVIFGSADLDVSQIDRESLRLAGVAPVRDRIRRVYSHADRARDDYHDLVLKFKTKQLIKALEIPLEKELENGDQVSLNLTGNLKDDGATPIEGEDTAVVFGKRHKHKKKGKWKNHWKWWR